MGAVREVGSLPHLSLNDDQTFIVQLGFSVFIDDVEYWEVNLSNNGVVEFSRNGYRHQGEYTPEPVDRYSPSVVLYPFHGDVDTRGVNLGRVEYGTVDVGDYRAFVVTWSNVSYYGGPYRSSSAVDARNTFQLVLYDVGYLVFEFNIDQCAWEAGTASGGEYSTGLYNMQYPIVPGSEAPAIVGYWINATNQWLKQGSYVPRALLDSNEDTGLIHNSRNSDVLGRYAYGALPGINGDYLGARRSFRRLP